MPEQVVDYTLIRILAYVKAVYVNKEWPPSGLASLRAVNIHPDGDGFIGFGCDVTVEIETSINGRIFVAFADNYGGEIHETADHARYEVLNTTGVLPEFIPDWTSKRQDRENSHIVAQVVQEFRPTLKPGPDVEKGSAINAIVNGDRKKTLTIVPKVERPAAE